MAEEEKRAEKTEGETPVEAKPKAGKKILIISAVLIVDLVVMAGIAFYIVGKLKSDEVGEAALKEQEEASKKAQEMHTQMGMVLPKPLELTVNITGETGQPHYLKCAVQLEWDDVGHPLLVAEISRRLPKITDMIINILSAHTYEEMLKPAGKKRIQETIVSDVNAILPEAQGKIRNAFFTEFLVQ